MNKSDWVWMPHAAHFILGPQCQFILATYLGNGYIVSTVGELWPDRAVRQIHAKVFDPEWHKENNHRMGDDYDHAYRQRFGFEEIGYHRKYETIVFKAMESEESCCPWQIIVSDDVDYDGSNDARSARENHMIMCERWSHEKI